MIHLLFIKKLYSHTSFKVNKINIFSGNIYIFFIVRGNDLNYYLLLINSLKSQNVQKQNIIPVYL